MDEGCEDNGVTLDDHKHDHVSFLWKETGSQADSQGCFSHSRDGARWWKHSSNVNAAELETKPCKARVMIRYNSVHKRPRVTFHR